MPTIAAFEQYIKALERPVFFVPTGLTKADYLTVMERCLGAYSEQELQSMRPEDDLQTYARLLSVMGVLLSQKRICHRFAQFVTMMDAACLALPTLSVGQMMDFSVKELMLAYRAMKHHVPEKTRQTWHQSLAQINPDAYYLRTSGNSNNINIYNLAGEYLREKEGMTNTSNYFDRCWPDQLRRFDQNGMYLDEYPHSNNPMLYDITTRVQMQLIVGEGYDGRYQKALDDLLIKGGWFTLFMQSSAYHLPFGGRSNQYLFNEALIASNCEFEAARHQKLGNHKLAGAHKRAARLAVQSIERYLAADKHIKNFYKDCTVGTEQYGYYNKYMITMASFLAIGYLYADDSVEEWPCPAERGGFVFELPPTFHKVFANCGGYSLQFETNADTHYDSNGLGRIHKTGVPAELGLSVPFAANPSYTLPPHGVGQLLSICPGWKQEGEVRYCSELLQMKHTLKTLSQTKQQVVFQLEYNDCVQETYTVDENGVFIHAKWLQSGEQTLYYRIPFLLTNGKDTTKITSSGGWAQAEMNGFCYRVETDGQLQWLEQTVANRNGEYRVAQLQKNGGEISLHLQLF